jgi:hypothetical protein
MVLLVVQVVGRIQSGGAAGSGTANQGYNGGGDRVTSTRGGAGGGGAGSLDLTLRLLRQVLMAVTVLHQHNWVIRN